MSACNMKYYSLAIVFMAMHVLLTADIAASARTKASSTQQASAAFVKAKEAVEKSLSRAKDTVGLLTQKRAELGNRQQYLTALNDCIELTGACVEDLKAVSSELAKGEGQLKNPGRAEDIVGRMNGAVIREDTCLFGLPDEGSDGLLATVVDNIILTDKIFSESLEILYKALDP